MMYGLRSSDDEQFFDSPEQSTVSSSARQSIAIYVDRGSQQWVVRDPHGDFWVLPPLDDSWQHRQPFPVTQCADLEAVPSHYRYMLNLPF